MTTLGHSIAKVDQGIERMMCIIEGKPMPRFDKRTPQNKMSVSKLKELESRVKIGFPLIQGQNWDPVTENYISF